MEVSAPVSGGRWRCACCEIFISHQELQLCGLTQEALTKFAGKVSSTRSRVEFRADKSLHLLPEKELRSTNQRRQPAVQKSNGDQGKKEQQQHRPSKESHQGETAPNPPPIAQQIIIEIDDDSD
jgi:hypothetical protein